ncbi:Wzz/FepE/Etk N-terminal domain-containing protein [Blastococcus montanus]|uniref:YveK family protein n=1 Tax=Blastococcus montanus TaxID=3144973 RepID=UPI003208CEEB
MELHDYLTALRRHWRVWAGVTVMSLLAALFLNAVLPRTYVATAQVFVASTSESTAGFQFVTQRVKSYLDVVDSPAVLEPVIDELALDRSLEALRADVSAGNPADTSRVDISVTSCDPAQAAAIANAAAERFTTAVEELEAPAGSTSPVRLTVTGPASPPASPESPRSDLLLALGLVVGAFLGAALAVVRSRMDTSLHTPEDVRRAWGTVDGRMPPLLAAPEGRGRRSRLTGRPAALLARRLEALAEYRPVRVLLISPAPGNTAPLRLATEVAGELREVGTAAAVSGTSEQDTEAAGQVGSGDRRARVRLAVGDPLLPVRDRRRLTGQYDAVVLVLEDGRVDAAELREMRDMLDVVQVRPLALVLVPATRATLRGEAVPPPVLDPLPTEERRRADRAPAGSAS